MLFLKALLHDDREEWRVFYDSSHQLFPTSALEISILNFETTSIDLLNKTGQQQKQQCIYPHGDDPKYFRTISARHKGIIKSLTAPLCPPLRREWNQSLDIKTSNSSCWTNAVVTVWGCIGGGGFIYTLLTFFAFILQASEVSLLCYIESKKEDWGEESFLLCSPFYIKAADSLWATETKNG